MNFEYIKIITKSGTVEAEDIREARLLIDSMITEPNAVNIQVWEKQPNETTTQCVPIVNKI